MTPPYASRNARGFTLLEMLLLLPLLAVFSTMVFWVFVAQLSVHRRMAEQANRQAVMRAVLNQLRGDLARSSRVEFLDMPAVGSADRIPTSQAASSEAARDSWRPPGTRTALCVLRAQTLDGIVEYHLSEHTLICQRPDDTTERSTPLPQTLLRRDADGTTKTWSLHGQTLTLTPGPAALARTIAICFESRLRSKAGREVLRRFRTTLLVGGGP
jgi:type II secretory pathway component PulJ